MKHPTLSNATLWERAKLYCGLAGNSMSVTQEIETASDKRMLFGFPEPPFWLRIGPINWEGRY